MKIQGAIILVELDDEKVYQVDISSDSVITLLKYYQVSLNTTIDIIDKPFNNITLARKVLNEAERD